ncbi:MAG: radical SAM protein [Planctomycetaceae bacterium]|nr:radical SAM protein [Planctomycetaceae bacterium]
MMKANQSLVELQLIRDHSIYVLNPLFRLRNEFDYVLIYGFQGIGTWRLHRSYGVLTTLFDGCRTILDIANIVSPMVDADDIFPEHKLSIALNFVKSFVALMSKSKAEQMGRSNVNSSFPSESLLLLQEDATRLYADQNMFHISYSTDDFLPSKSRLAANGPFHLIRDSVPHILNWHLTSSCSTDCRYCYLGRRTNIVPMHLERIFSLIEESIRIGVFSIELLGGDVMLYPYLIDVMQKLHQHQFLPMTLSTKSFVSLNVANSLGKLKELIYEMQFSIDTDDDMIARQLVGTANFPETIFESIDNAVHTGLNVTAKSVITPYNIFTIPRLYRKLRQHGVQKIRLAAYSRSGFHHSDDLFLAPEHFEWLYREIEQLNSEFPQDQIQLQNGQAGLEPRSLESLKESWSLRSLCTAGRSTLMICSDGKVIPCEQMPETEEYFCGDVSKQSIMEVWNGDKLKEMTYGMPHEKFKGQPCYNCEEQEDCLDHMGICIRDLAVHYGNIYQPPPNCYRNILPFVRQT